MRPGFTSLSPFSNAAMAAMATLAAFATLVCCTDAQLDKTVDPVPVDPQVDAGDASVAAEEAGADAADAARDASTVRGNLRVMAANTSSGPALKYGPADGVRIFQGLKPDVVLIQEFNVGANSVAELGSYVTTTFGAGFTYYREPAGDIPNGIISRYPILASGSWDDPQVDNRGFAYAKIAIPGGKPLWAVSLHLLTSSPGARAPEAAALVAQVRSVIPEGDYLVVGGDLNTGARDEACITTLSGVVTTAGPYPDDGEGNEATNAPRSEIYDWLLVDKDLTPLEVPVTIGQRFFGAGLVFDSRVYAPLGDVAPVQATDSAAQNMQHMPVVRDFLVPN